MNSIKPFNLGSLWYSNYICNCHNTIYAWMLVVILCVLLPCSRCHYRSFDLYSALVCWYAVFVVVLYICFNDNSIKCISWYKKYSIKIVLFLCEHIKQRSTNSIHRCAMHLSVCCGCGLLGLPHNTCKWKRVQRTSELDSSTPNYGTKTFCILNKMWTRTLYMSLFNFDQH